MNKIMRPLPGKLGGKERLFAHRGFTPAAPQNSLAAFREAGAQRFWAIETDVHRTADGHLVCIHDRTVDSTYCAAGEVRELTLEQLLKLERRELDRGYPAFGKNADPFYWRPEELRMPLFSQYLGICRASGAVPFIELKTSDVEQVLTEATRFFKEEEIAISSSDFGHLEAVRALTDRVFIHHIFSDEDHMKALARMGHGGLSYNYPDLDKVPEGIIEKTHEQGVRVCLRAGDTVEKVNRMYEMGLDYIPTNRVRPCEL